MKHDSLQHSEHTHIKEASKTPIPIYKDPDLDPLARLKKELPTGIITVYHGGHKLLPQLVAESGFRASDAAQILRDAYELEGIPWETRKKFPEWTRNYIESDVRYRLTVHDIAEGKVSFALTKEVARRWAHGTGEISNEARKRIRIIQAAMKAGIKSEQDFDKWFSVQPPSVLDVYPQEEGTVVAAKLRLTPAEVVQLERTVQQYENFLKVETPVVRQLMLDHLRETYYVIHADPSNVVEFLGEVVSEAPSESLQHYRIEGQHLT